MAANRGELRAVKTRAEVRCIIWYSIYDSAVIQEPWSGNGANSALDSLSQCGVVAAFETKGGTKFHPRAPWRRESCGFVKHLFQALDAHRDHRNFQPRHQHSNTRLKWEKLTGIGAFSFREDEDAVALRGEVCSVAERVARAGLALRQRERVEGETSQ